MNWWQIILLIVVIIVISVIALIGALLINRNNKVKHNQPLTYWVIDLDADKIRVCYLHHRKRDHIYVRIPSLDSKVKEIIWDEDYNNWLFKSQLGLRNPELIGRNTTKVTIQDQVKHDDKKS
jgi:hypothetical protein